MIPTRPDDSVEYKKVENYTKRRLQKYQMKNVKYKKVK